MIYFERSENPNVIKELNKIYIGTSALKKLSAKEKVNRLLDELNDFNQLIDEYYQSNNETLLEDIAVELNNTSEFTAFKRQIIRDDQTLNQALAHLMVN